MKNRPPKVENRPPEPSSGTCEIRPVFEHFDLQVGPSPGGHWETPPRRSFFVDFHFSAIFGGIPVFHFLTPILHFSSDFIATLATFVSSQWPPGRQLLGVQMTTFDHLGSGTILSPELLIGVNYFVARFFLSTIFDVTTFPCCQRFVKSNSSAERIIKVFIEHNNLFSCGHK